MLFDANNVELDEIEKVTTKPEQDEDTNKKDAADTQPKENVLKKEKPKLRSLKKLKVISGKKNKPELKKSETAELKDKKKKKEKVYSRVPELLPFVDVTEDDYFELKNGTMEIFQIDSEDIKQLNDLELHYKIMSMTKFLRTYSHDFKWVSMGYPVTTNDQLEYWQLKLAEAENPVYKQFIQRKIDELNFLEKNYFNRDYYLFLYSDEKSLDSLKDNIKSVKNTHRNALSLKDIPQEKKYQILYKMNNQNSKIKS
ncbi:hypothetical protein EH11_04261 [Bacillus subtilis]|uniref:hypothetical protein n=1 Tax=Bacillus subtilis TaxID=1423 RepID=UPI000F53862B|nr:hypothetical protein [Bacillus subtilis]RPJ98180.1 hypothetical protein EH11_04261 [Bacillus subtilis]